MKILLTGVGGFIGSYLAKKWDNGANELVCIARNRKPADINARVISADLSGPLDYCEPVDVIVHAAAQSPAPGITMDDYLCSNVDAVRNITKYARRFNIKKIIYLSSVLLYGEASGSIIDEGTPVINPQNYGLTKYIGEKLLEEEGLTSIALRLPGVLGKGASTPWLVKTAHRLKRNERVELYNPDALFNNMIHVVDLEKFISHLMGISWTGHEKVTLGCRESIPIREAALFLKKCLESDSEISIIESGEKSFTISVDKALKMGYNPMTAEKILKTYCEDCSCERLS